MCWSDNDLARWCRLTVWGYTICSRYRRRLGPCWATGLLWAWAGITWVWDAQELTLTVQECVQGFEELGAMVGLDSTTFTLRTVMVVLVIQYSARVRDLFNH